MLEKNPRSVFWNSLPSPRVSQRNGTVHYLLHHLYFYCTSKHSSSTTKNRWGLILHYFTPTLHSPLQTKPFSLLTAEMVGKVANPPLAGKNKQFLVLSASPPADTGTRNTSNPHGGGTGTLSISSAPVCSTADNRDLGIWWLYCTSCSVLGLLLVF